MNRAVTIVGLTGLWLVLWRDLSVANVASGVLVATVVSTVPRRPGVRHRVRPFALIRFLGYFTVKLLEANVVLAREVVTPRNSINTGIIAVPLPQCSDFVAGIVANAVSLTPGTLTLEATGEPVPVLYVHVLHLRDIPDARREVLDMAARAVAAFPQVPAPAAAPEATP